MASQYKEKLNGLYKLKILIQGKETLMQQKQGERDAAQKMVRSLAQEIGDLRRALLEAI